MTYQFSRRAMCRALLLGSAGLVAGCSTPQPAAPPGSTAEPRAVPAVDGIVAALRDHPVVAIGETHGSLELHDFLLTLIRDARFAAAAQVVAVEVGATAQPAIDAYLDRRLGDKALLATLRNSIFSDSGAADPRTVDLYRTVRDANADREPHHRTRILAADAPLSWQQVPASDTVDKDREAAMAAVIGAGALDQRQRVLWVVGGAHLATQAARGALERHAGQPIYTLSLYTGFGRRTQELEGRTAAWPVPAVVPTRGTWLTGVDQLGNPGAPGDVMQPVDPPARGTQPLPGTGLPTQPVQPTLADVDALLFLGRCGGLRPMLPPRSVFADHTYAAELNRRSRVMWGRDFDVDAYYAAASAQFGGRC
ncbi:hypothetical protein [Micromonospora sp. ATCC 39149]|uniref:ChaN family lipoprotein n=1 Tax=Micromonospora carbonacea TaxID=47853 RepID=A0A7D6CG57_9ACTN|nr:hypothetical protein [Micromonospora sp. ATCC 39149]QLK00679.1 hypothetical protein HZU44_12130 [Micromonospora carbonacea]